ncbi:SDR family NAD(P)-dependent oxidoreductase [Ostreibacterium oceani]|uniref:SDR family NAD(P)-dependent oxidoreductase n=1 Tax=Ostreibacterium oceani TaxID=2654998 RepID=A0A6N7EWS5_9GAMM|nr:SDR family NAD(P)-dependent oxidoreductase [Ostreibacterium oceani]MPV85577.1 SDR family NAD(P)-dependent oxidoreductase [Ostreibacterium oceani]
MKHIVVFGASGSIGQAITQQLAKQHESCTIYAGSRQDMFFEQRNIHSFCVDPLSDESLQKCANDITVPLDMIIITLGMLHDSHVQPEKSLRQVELFAMQKIFNVNTFAPALIMKHFMPKLNKSSRTLCAALSARVGSISDNRLGGWYSYRASKSALNMMIKCASIEYKRSHPKSIFVGLHPGTVNSQLSKPFQANIPDAQLFSPNHSAQQLLDVLGKLDTTDSGRVFDYAGHEIQP